MPVLRPLLAFALLTLLAGTRAFGATGAPPFVVTASAGPAAGSHITATVTRTIGKTSVTLPAALVPALAPGDVVDVDFPGYRRPPGTVNYHVNVAFITETAPQRWFFPRSVPADRLFTNPRAGKHAKTVPGGHLHFVYGSSYYRGIPIFTIVPEDAKTRGVDGVRDYVNAHPSDFVAMAQSTNDAVDKYSYLRDFLGSLANGSIDPATGRQRIESVAQGLGVPPATIDACYATGGSNADVDNCVQQAVESVEVSTNFNAPTQAQFLGGVAGAAEPLALAPYIGSLLTVWNIFVHTGHLEYEYLPTTIALADPSTARRDELLMGVKVPTVRPPAAVSDVLFFTIGDPQASEAAPVVVNDAPAGGVCERTNRFSVPLHFDHTSRYVHDAALVVTPDGHAPYTIALDPRSLDAPIVDASRFTGSTDGAYSVALEGRFGFAPVGEPAHVAMRLALPGAGNWRIAAVAHHPPIAGEALDVIASSPGAACLSHAELQVGSAPPEPLTATQLDDERVELHASLADQPAGPAQLRIYEDDPREHRDIESAYQVAIQPPPARVNAASAVAALGDAIVHLAGSDLERIRGLLVDGVTYVKEPGATSTSACFDGPPLDGPNLVSGQKLVAQLQTVDGTPGQVFPLTLAARRPALAHATPARDATGVHLSTVPLTVTLDGGGTPLPRDFSVRVRQDVTAQTPCAALAADPLAVTLPAGDLQPRSATEAAVRFAPAVLQQRAFGTLDIRIVDAASGLGSAWIPLPGTFVRAPEITSMVCPPGGGECRLYGTDLATIDAVETAPLTFVAPDPGCPPTSKGVACVYVPHLAHYTLRLVDGGTLETLPDSLPESDG